MCAFVGLILVPALGSYGRAWEKLVAGFLSLFVLAALVLIGLVIGVVIFLNWDEIELDLAPGDRCEAGQNVGMNAKGETPR